MTTVLHIEGMSCGNCVRHATTALQSVAGVQTAEVDLDTETAVVEHDDELDVQTLLNAVNEEGYEASLPA
jgi:copper chaperone CopZ